MQKSNLFFTYLSKLYLQKKNQKDDNDNSPEELIQESNESSKSDNEWLQEYELIYSSYSIDGY